SPSGSSGPFRTTVCGAFGLVPGQTPQYLLVVQFGYNGSLGSQRLQVDPVIAVLHAIAESGVGQALTFPGTESPAVAVAVRPVEKPRIGIAKKVLMGTFGVVTRTNRACAFSVGLIASNGLYGLAESARFL